MRKIIILGILQIGILVSLLGQYSAKFDRDYELYFQGLSHFQDKNYGIAKAKFEEFLSKDFNINSIEKRNYVQKAELLIAKSELYQGSDLAEGLFIKYIKKYSPSPETNEATFDLANFYFDSRRFKTANKYFQWVNANALAQNQRSELFYKYGYTQYIAKDYDQAIKSFQQVKDEAFAADAAYYTGHCYYNTQNYQAAVNAWRKVENHPNYGRSIPYSITQVLFSQGQYKEAIEYGESAILNDNVQNKDDIYNLVGKSYFELGTYDQANNFLEKYDEGKSRLTLEDYYQLGFTRYKSGDYKGAIDAFVKLDSKSSDLSQFAMYYLADSYSRLGMKSEARNAFYRVSQFDNDQELKENAYFTFAKLSAEQNLDSDAINALMRIPTSSPKYPESQTLLKNILSTTNDTKKALSILDEMGNLNVEMQNAYQIVAFKEGVKHLSKGNLRESESYFQKSLQYKSDRAAAAQSYFWLAEIAHRNKNYESSNQYLGQYFNSGVQAQDLPPEARPGFAYYLKAYNAMKVEDYASAEQDFQNFFQNLEDLQLDPENEIRLVSHAGLRLADCYLVQRKYNQALSIYQENIDNQYEGYDYALYQKAIIQGLQRNNQGKISTLGQIIRSFPSSEFRDNAYLEQGNTYIETGELESSISTLEQMVLEYNRKSTLVPQAYAELGLAYYNKGEVQKSLNSYKKIFENNPNSEQARNALNAIEEIYVYNLQNPDGYLQFANTIPGYKTDNAQRDSLNYIVGYSQYELGEYAQATNKLGQYLKQFPKGLYVLDAHYYKGESHSLLKQYDAAVGEYERLIQQRQNPYYTEVLRKAALIHYNHTQNFQKAFEFYTALEKVSTDKAIVNESQIGAFRSAYRLGKNQETISYARKIINNPDALPELKSTAQFYVAKVEYDAKKYSDVISLLNSSIQSLDGEDLAEARYLLAASYYYSGNNAVAKEKCQEAYKLSSGYPLWVAKGLILFSDILLKEKDYFNAKAALDAVIENYSDNQAILKEAQTKKSKLEKLESEAYNIGDSSNE